MSSRRIAAAVAAGLSFAAASAAVPPAFAAETVAVQLVGERGGQMGIELDKKTVPAGDVTFTVVNAAKQTPHEMAVIWLDSPDQKLQVDPSTNKVDESKLKSLGEVEGLKAGQDGNLKVNLKAGNYMLICNYKGHVAAGMAVPFKVTAASS